MNLTQINLVGMPVFGENVLRGGAEVGVAFDTKAGEECDAWLGALAESVGG